MAAALQGLAEKLPGEARPTVSPPEGYAPQVVFSGDSRWQIADRRIATEDTDLDIRADPSNGKAPGIAASSLQNPTATRLNQLIENPPSALNAILSSLSMILVFNMFAAMVVSVTGQNVYNVGWAFEIYLAAGFFTLLAWAIKKPWLLTPAIILFGNAVVLSYSALTGRWQDWIFLWMFEPIIVAVAILVPIALKKNTEQGAFLTRASSFLLTVLAVLMAASTCWLSFIINLFR
jgi:hypothetical protein